MHIKQYYINHNITQWIGSRLSVECPHAYWITQPVIEICSSYVPITTHREGLIWEAAAEGWVKVLKHYSAMFTVTGTAAVERWFQALRAVNGGDAERPPSPHSQHGQRGVCCEALPSCNNICLCDWNTLEWLLELAQNQLSNWILHRLLQWKPPSSSLEEWAWKGRGENMEVDLVNSWESARLQRAAGHGSDRFQLRGNVNMYFQDYWIMYMTNVSGNAQP